VITSCSVFSRKSVRYMNAGMRVANLISFSCTSLRLDLYSFSSSVSCVFCFSVRSLPFALFLSSFTFSLLLMMVSMMLSPSAPPALDTFYSGHCLGVIKDSAQRVIVHVHQQCALPFARQQRGGGARHRNVQNAASIDLNHDSAVVGQYRQERYEILDGVFRIRLVWRESDAVFRELTSARVGAKSNTKHAGLRISSSFGLSPFGFLMDHGDCTRKAA